MNKLTLKEWEEKYKPIPNPVEPEYGDTFPPYDEGWELIVKAKDETPNKVWTQFAYAGQTSIHAGFSEFGTAIGYFITEIAWESEDVQTYDYGI